WQTAFADGTALVVSSDGNVAGSVFRHSIQLNPLCPVCSKGCQKRVVREIVSLPTNVDGTMFTNDTELYLYGFVHTTPRFNSQLINTVAYPSDRLCLRPNCTSSPRLRSLPIWPAPRELEPGLLPR